MHFALCVAALAFAFLDCVRAGPNNRAPLLGLWSSFSQGDLWKSTKAHFMTPGEEGVTQNPLSTAVLPLLEPETAAIRVLAWGFALKFRGREAVERAGHPVSPFQGPLKYGV
jgi:hypothetical protein